MKLKEYIEALQRIANMYPNVTVVSSSDEEGNSFSKVVYGPTVGMFRNEKFSCEPGQKINAVCLN